MSLPRQPRTVRKRVVALHDAKPRSVSLVKAGANKTPFRVTKADEVEIDAVPNGDGTFDVAFLRFDAAKHDEASVTKWLNDGGYTDYVIQKDDAAGVFTVSAKGAEIEQEKVRGPIVLDGGVSIFVLEGVRSEKSEEAPSGEQAEVQPVAISMDVAAKKFDTYAAAGGWNGKTLKEILENASYDGLPLGIYDLTAALYGAVKTNFREGDLPAMRAAVSDFGDKLDALAKLFPHPKLPDLALKGDDSIPDYDRAALVAALAPDFTVVQKGDGEMPKDNEGAAAQAETDAQKEEAQKAAFTACGDCKTSENCAKKGECADKMGAKKDDATEAAASEQNEAAAPGADAEAQKTETAGAADAGTEVIVPDWAKAMFGTLTKSVGDLAETVKTGLLGVAQKADALEQKVADISGAGSHQTRKGADVEDATAGSQKSDEERKKADEFETFRRNAVLGIRK